MKEGRCPRCDGFPPKMALALIRRNSIKQSRGDWAAVGAGRFLD